MGFVGWGVDVIVFLFIGIEWIFGGSRGNWYVVFGLFYRGFL